MASFQIATSLFDRFPELRVGLIRLKLPEALPVGAVPAAQVALAEAHKLPATVDFGPWHEAFRWFGSKPKKYRCAAEALLMRVKAGGDIPSILPLVDLYNAVSIRTGLPIGGDDLARLLGTRSVHSTW